MEEVVKEVKQTNSEIFSMLANFLSQPYLMLCKFLYNTVRAHDRENHVFNKLTSGGGVSTRCCMFLWKVILVVGDV